MNLASSCFESLTTEQLVMLRSCFDRTEGMISFEEGAFLYCLAKSSVKGCIVEVGSYRGRSTVFLGRGSLDGAGIPVYAVDPHKPFNGILGGVFGPADRTAFFRCMVESNCSEIVSLINLSSECFCPFWREPVSLLWIDGDHSYVGVKRDIDCWLPHLQFGATIAFDDASDLTLGPAKLIQELIESGKFVKVASVGKIVAIQQAVQRGIEGI